jgi:hypothetical protein
MRDKPKYSPEIIRRYRELDDAEGFTREIVTRVPMDPTWDAVTFTCGHKWQALARLLDTLCGKAKCWICSDAWLTEAARAEQRKGEKPEMRDEPKHSPEIIRRYQEMEKADGFTRAVVTRVPVDLTWDEITFACGHKWETTSKLLELNDGKAKCHACAEEWLAERVREEKPE